MKCFDLKSIQVYNSFLNFYLDNSMHLRPREMPPKKKIRQGSAPDSVKANPEVKKKLASLFQNNEIDASTSFSEVWSTYSDFHCCHKEKFRRFFNTFKKNITELDSYAPVTGMFLLYQTSII